MTAGCKKVPAGSSLAVSRLKEEWDNYRVEVLGSKADGDESTAAKEAFYAGIMIGWCKGTQWGEVDLSALRGVSLDLFGFTEKASNGKVE